MFVPKELWQDEHQAFELSYHQRDNIRWHDPEFIESWRRNFGEFLELTPDHFREHHRLLDVGCGSRPPIPEYFKTGAAFAVEPLAKDYAEIPEVAKYWTDDVVGHTFMRPAEERIEALCGTAEFVNCFNVLDHTYDWRAVLINALQYASPGGIVCICTDIASHGAGHPGIDSVADLMNIVNGHGTIEKMEINYQGTDFTRELALKIEKY